VVAVSASAPLKPTAAHALLHFTVFIWGFTAILGRSISISAVPLVWYRLLIVLPIMAGLMWFNNTPFRADAKRVRAWFGIGALVAFHWLMFYGCIKYAGVAVAVLCLSATTFFTALFEPVVFRRAVVKAELGIGAAVVIGVALIVRFETQTNGLGLVLGLGSALCSAMFGTLNGVYAKDQPSQRVTLYELSAGAAVTTLFFILWPADFVMPSALSLKDLGLLLVLSIVCTVLPWQWSLRILQTLSPYTVALAVSLEPVYSMGLAYVLFPDSEQLTGRFYLGAAMLVLLVLVNSQLKRSPPEPL
jgi:drug/metabolite transporter (DMT)-like permease